MGVRPPFPARIDQERFRSAERRELPTFLGVGMPKCGTTWVHAILKAHPEIGMPVKPVGPPAKEFNFWTDGDCGIDTHAYLAAFRSCPEPIRGEYSTMYCDRRVYLERIRHCLPGVKIVVGFRDPATALHSAYLHSLRAGRRYEPFAAWLDDYIATYGPIYNYDRVMRDLEMFPRDDVFLYFYEDVLEWPESFAVRLYRFLGADPAFRPQELMLRFNARYEYRSRKVYLATVETLIRLYGNHRGRTMVSAPHTRPRWVHLLLRANERQRSAMPQADRAYALSRVGHLCEKFARRHGKADEWGLS